MVIGISGKKQHGKNTVATIIQYLFFLKKLEAINTKPFNNSDVFNYTIFSHWSENERLEYSGWLQKQFAYKLKLMVAILLGCTVDKFEDNDFKEAPLGEDWQRWYWTHYKYPTKSGRITKLCVSKEEAEAERFGNKTIPEYFGEASRLEFDTLTPRKMLQILGTEGTRDTIHSNIWINALMVDYVVTMDAISHTCEAVHKDGRYYVPEDPRVPQQYWNMMTDTKLFQWDELIKNGMQHPNWIITDVRFPEEARVIQDMGGKLIRVDRPQIQSNDTHTSETALDDFKGWDVYIRNTHGIEELITIVSNSLRALEIL